MRTPSRFALVFALPLAIALAVFGCGRPSGQPASTDGTAAQTEDVKTEDAQTENAQTEDVKTENTEAATASTVSPDVLLGTVWHAHGESDPDDFGFYLEFPSKDHCYLMWVYGGGITGVEEVSYQVDGTSLLMDEGFSGDVSAAIDQITLIVPDGTTLTFTPNDRQLTPQEDFVELITYIDPIWNADGTRFRTIGADASDSAESAETEAPQTVENEVVSSSCVVVVMPSEWVAKGLTWILGNENLNLEYTYQGERVMIAGIDWSERSETPYEVAEERWPLGEGTVSGEMRKVVLHIPYVDKQGRVFHANTDTDRDTLAPEYYLGLSPEEILSWIEAGGTESGLSATTDGLSKRTSEFCGIWAFATKDLREAVTFSNEARQRGFAAEVFLTTNWSNLNDEPWYVVSLGCAYSEEEAYRVLQSAQNSIYGDAYVKWTGSYIG